MGGMLAAIGRRMPGVFSAQDLRPLRLPDGVQQVLFSAVKPWSSGMVRDLHALLQGLLSASGATPLLPRKQSKSGPQKP
jgi:hypothetical protein